MRAHLPEIALIFSQFANNAAKPPDTLRTLRQSLSLTRDAQAEAYVHAEAATLHVRFDYATGSISRTRMLSAIAYAQT
jgi:hypothetical protein